MKFNLCMKDWFSIYDIVDALNFIHNKDIYTVMLRQTMSSFSRKKDT